MSDKRFTPLLASILLGLVLGALSLTMVMLTSVRAEGTGDDITIIKGPAQQKITSGSTANFTIQVSNNSGVTITDVTVSDPLVSDCDRLIGILKAGESSSYGCSRPGEEVVTDFTNWAMVAGFKLVGTSSTPVSDTAEAFVDVLPTIEVTKTAVPPIVAEPGDTVTFTVRVGNTSAEPVTLSSLVDDVHGNLNGQGDCDLSPPPTIAAGGYYECAFSATISGNAGVSETDTVTATASDDENNAVQASDDATVVITDLLPSILVTKSADPTVVRPGDAVDFTVRVDNLSVVEPLTLTGLDDTFFGDLATECSLPISITEGSFFECVITGTFSSDHTNIVTATVRDDEGNETTDSDDASVNVISPAIEIAKTPEMQIVSSSSAVSFTLTVNNPGDVELFNLNVMDVQCDTLTGPSGDDGDGILQTTETWTYICTVNNVTDGFINVATVTGTPPAGANVTDTDAAKVILAEALACPVDMIAYWRLDETSGTFGYDDFYNGHDGVCVGQCPTSTTGRVNGGQEFNGSNTGIDVPPVPGDDSFNWGVDDSFSIEFWVQPDTSACSGANEVVVGRIDRADSSNKSTWWVGCQDGGEAAFYLRDTGGATEFINGTIDLTDGSWHHVVAVREKDVSQDRIRLYVDGQEERSTSADYRHGFDSPTAALNIGWFNVGSYYHFAGTVDEIALYDRALSASEIQQHYYEGGLTERWYCEPGSFAPKIFSTPVTEAAAQWLYTYDVDAIGDPVPTYTLTISPAGMTIDPVTGLISWKPVVAQQGSHPVEVEAGNTEGTDVQSFAIEVARGPICPADMISYWKLDETSGTTYADFYNGNDGTCEFDQCPSPTAGQVNGGQVFNGNDTEINVPADASFDWGVDDSFSIEFWVQPDTSACSGANEVVVGRKDVTDNSNKLTWWVGCQDGGEAAFYLGDMGGATRFISGTTDLTDGPWHHVVAVREKDVSQDRIRLYVDGQEERSTSASYSSGFGSSTAALNVGWFNVGSHYHFTGTVDEIALYNKALSPTEIQQHRDRGRDGRGYCFNPKIAITKDANQAVIYAGERVTYTYTVTNTGDDPLSSVSVNDDRCSSVDFVGGDDDSDDELDLDETWTYTCLMVLSADTTNTATAIGTYSPGDTVSDTATAFVTVINPTIAIRKTATPETVYTGDTVTYTYTVTNPGDDPLSNVGVSDDWCSPGDPAGDDNWNNKLDPDETWTYVCSMTLFADTANTAIVTGTDSLGSTVSDTATAFVDVINPDIAINKQANLTMVSPGATVTYTYTVSNPGDDPLSSVNVSDDRCSPVTRVEGDEDLNPSEAWTYICSMTLYTDTTNTAIVTGIDSLGGIISDTATALVYVSKHQIYLPIVLNDK